MKKSYKLLLSLGLLLSTLPMTGCVFHHSTGATMDELVGIYKLTEYTKRDENQEEYDYLALKNIEAYFVVTGTDEGYVYYKDNDTNAYTRSVDIEYILETDEEKITESSDTVYNAVRYYTRLQRYYTYLGGPGSKVGEEQMGINKKNHTLNYTVTYHEYYQLFSDKIAYIQEYQRVMYTRVSEGCTYQDLVTLLNLTGELVNEPIKARYVKINGNIMQADKATATLLGHEDAYLLFDIKNNKFDYYYTDELDTVDNRQYIKEGTYDYTETKLSYPNEEEVYCITINNSPLGESVVFPLKYNDGTAPSYLFTDSLLTPEITNNLMFYGVLIY